MVAYLVDTNHLSPLVTPMHPLRSHIRTAMDGGDEFFFALPSLTEVVAGFSILPRAVQNRREWALMRPTLELVMLDEQDALDAADLQVSLRRRGAQLATVDALIATVALRYGLVLLTTDADFQAVPGLVIENWLLTP